MIWFADNPSVQLRMLLWLGPGERRESHKDRDLLDDLFRQQPPDLWWTQRPDPLRLHHVRRLQPDLHSHRRRCHYPLPTWTAASTSCLAEGTSGRALAADSMTSPSMTVAMCVNYCDSKGYQYAGIEYCE
jgi:hypothetical protein